MLGGIFAVCVLAGGVGLPLLFVDRGGWFLFGLYLGFVFVG